jgi:hypothetical protein
MVTDASSPMPPRPRSRLRGSTLVGLAVLALWGTSIPYGVERYFGGDPRILLRLGADFRHPEALRGVPFFGRAGYDGQFFAALATDPLLLRPETASFLDAPLYRAGRIGLPLLAWGLAAGNDPAAILVYQLLCWSLGALCAWIVARWLEDEGHSPLWAVPLALSGGVVASMYSSLPDAAACSFLVAALWLHRRGRTAWSIAVLAFACLVKETNVVAAAAIAAAELRDGRFRRAALSAAVPIAVLLVWRAWVLSRPGFGDAALVADNFGVPLAWIPRKLQTPIDAFEVFGLAGLALAFASLPALLPAVRRWTPVESTLAGFTLLALFLNELVYIPVWFNYTRVLAPLPMLAALSAEHDDAAWRRWLLRAMALAWSILGVMMLYRWAAALAAVVAVAETVRRLLTRARMPDALGA